MTPFDSIVTLGDSWSYGSELPEDQRAQLRFDRLLGDHFGVEVTNLAAEGSSNFCYKWHWINWANRNPTVKQPLVVVGVTEPARQLIFSNQIDNFQETPFRLISESMIRSNWPNQPGGGGFIRTLPNYSPDFTNTIKDKCYDNFYRYNYNDKMGEIYALWEIKLLDGMIKEFGGYPIFWTYGYSYRQANLPWARDLLKNCQLVKRLTALPIEPIHIKGNVNHPNALGHRFIADALLEFVTKRVQNI
jgi:hypothetical protein